jgi:hypothetical protein
MIKRKAEMKTVIVPCNVSFLILMLTHIVYEYKIIKNWSMGKPMQQHIFEYIIYQSNAFSRPILVAIFRFDALSLKKEGTFLNMTCLFSTNLIPEYRHIYLVSYPELWCSYPVDDIVF